MKMDDTRIALVTFSLALLASLLCFTGCETVKTVAIDSLAVTVLNVNLQGRQTDYGGQSIAWPDRYAKIADWIQANMNTPGVGAPDIIALQEVHGESNVPFGGHVLPYEPLFTLLRKLHDQTGIQYRIAYLIVGPTPQGVSTLWAGKALLYNSNRVTKIPLASSVILDAKDQTAVGTHLRRSLRCDQPPTQFADLRPFIDGEGLAWVSSEHRISDGRWIAGPVLARFGRVGSPGIPFNIYNIHAPLATADQEQHRIQVEAFVSGMEAGFGNYRLYPPLVVGDFNRSLRDIPAHYPTFEIAGFSNRDVMGVLVGTQTRFPSQQAAYTQSRVVPEDWEYPAFHGSTCCGNLATLWSDHCGILTRISPVAEPPIPLPLGPVATGDRMQAEEVLLPGGSLSSANGQFRLVLQNDGNLILIKTSDDSGVWKTDTEVRTPGLCRLHDRHLLIHDRDGNLMWSSSYASAPGTGGTLTVEDDGRLRIVNAEGAEVWSVP
jgi:Endonuclease/Exonuclease/phosphatase family